MDIEDHVCLTIASMVWDDAVGTTWHQSRKSSHVLLPMININTSDDPRIFSTLKFVSELVQRHHVTPIITCDKPI